MKTYINFINENLKRNEKAKKYLIDQPYIIEDEKTKELKIVKLSYNTFPECITRLNSREYVKLTYSTLVRYLLFYWLYKYNGNYKILKKLKYIYINKIYNKYDYFTVNFSLIPTNYTLLKKYFKPFIGQTKINDSNSLVLAKLVYRRKKIFTEKNIINWYNEIKSIKKVSDKSEEDTMNFLKKLKLFDKLIKTNKFDDKSHVDIWAYKNGVKIPLQVKHPKKTINIDMLWSKSKKWIDKDKKKHDIYTIKINNTELDLGEINTEKDKIDWKYLFLWDNNKGKIYQINSTDIKTINKDKSNNIWIDMKLDKKTLPKMIKIYNIK